MVKGNSEKLESGKTPLSNEPRILTGLVFLIIKELVLYSVK